MKSSLFNFGATLLLITCTQSYVLLAANLNDFKKLAKKFVPEELAVQIADMAATSATNYSHDFEYPRRGSYQGQDDEDTLREEVPESDIYENQDEQVETLPQTREVTRLNFEDLVQKVKERIEEDMLKKKVLFTTKTPKDNNSYKYRGPDGRFSVAVRKDEDKYEDDKPDNRYPNQQSKAKPSESQKYHGYKQYKRPHITRLKERLGDTHANVKYVKDHHVNVKEDDDHVYADNQQTYTEKTRVKYADVKQSHAIFERNTEQTKPNADYDYEDEESVAIDQPKYNTPPDDEPGQLPYAKVNMLKNDSYEDYVTPEKEKNIYSSRESVKKRVVATMRTTKTTKRAVIPIAAANGYVKDDYKSDRANYDDDGEEMKAKTADLSYDEKVYNNTEDIQVQRDTTPMRKKKIGKGTNIPTRDYFKMSSPNYVAKIPVIAEKYDFNEPIPEQDREPENLRPIPPHPSVINGKVKLN